MFSSNERLICKKVCFKQSRKFQVKKRFDRPRRLLPGSVGSSFNVHMYWFVMKNLNVPDVLIVFLWRLNSQGYWFKKQSYKLSMSDFPKLYLATLWAHPCCALQFAWLACLSPKFWIGLDYDNTTVVNCLFSCDDLIILSFTHGAPIKAKLWLEESQYCKRGANTFQKIGAEL